MKKTLFLMLTIAMGFSCKNNEVSPTSNSIIGKLKSEKIETFVDDKLVGTEILKNNSSCSNHYEFLENNTYNKVGYSANCTENFRQTCSYTFKDSTLLLYHGSTDDKPTILYLI